MRFRSPDWCICGEWKRKYPDLDIENVYSVSDQGYDNVGILKYAYGY